MRSTTWPLRTAGTAAASVGLLAGTLASAPGAAAVTPTWATARYDCGTWGGTAVDFTASQAGASATLTLTLTSLTAPLGVPADSITTTLTLARNGGGETTEFTGRLSNPALGAGQPFTLGPLTGAVSPGDSLDSMGNGSYSLRFTVYGLPVNCSAGGYLFPGPFVF
ncbi:hypothetical protein [Streptomyces sp. YKOK-I1]